METCRLSPRGIVVFKILLLVSTRNSLGEEYRAQWPFFMFSGGASDQLAGYSIATEGLEEGAYNTNQKVPSSCDCWETGRAWHYSKCDIFECTCICDLTAGGHLVAQNSTTAQLSPFRRMWSQLLLRQRMQRFPERTIWCNPGMPARRTSTSRDHQVMRCPRRSRMSCHATDTGATQERMWIESTPNFLCQFKVPILRNRRQPQLVSFDKLLRYGSGICRSNALCSIWQLTFSRQILQGFF